VQAWRPQWSTCGRETFSRRSRQKLPMPTGLRTGRRTQSRRPRVAWMSRDPGVVSQAYPRGGVLSATSPASRSGSGTVAAWPSLLDEARVKEVFGFRDRFDDADLE